MDNLIHKYLDEIDELKSKVDKSSEKVLKRIDLDKLMENPRKYLKVLAKAYYEAHSDELLKAVDIGRGHAKDILKRS